jgi:hypothetical protein
MSSAEVKEKELSLSEIIDKRIAAVLNRMHKCVQIDRLQGMLSVDFRFHGAADLVAPVGVAETYKTNHWEDCGSFLLSFMNQPEVQSRIIRFLDTQGVATQVKLYAAKQVGYPQGHDYNLLVCTLRWTVDSPAQWEPYRFIPEKPTELDQVVLSEKLSSGC